MDFTLSAIENGNLVVSMVPPTPIAGWSIEYVQTHRFGGEFAYSGVGTGFSGNVTKWAASGYGNGVSGITINNSGTGVFTVALNPADVSGLRAGAHAYVTVRFDSGNVTKLSEGFRLMSPE